MTQSARGRLLAVDHVNIEATPGNEDAMRWFYGELIGLVERLLPPECDQGTGVIVFRSEKVELRIRLCEPANIESIACRAQFEVHSLAEVTELLQERKYPVVWRRGLTPTDRALYTHDPVGNRVELRRLARPGPF